MSAAQSCKSILLLGAWLFTGLTWGQSSSQDKAALQQERDRITAQLKTTENLLTKARQNRADASSQVGLLDKQIELREKLVRHHEASIRSLERSMRGTDSELRTLEGHVAALKDEYARWSSRPTA